MALAMFNPQMSFADWKKCSSCPMVCHLDYRCVILNGKAYMALTPPGLICDREKLGVFNLNFDTWEVVDVPSMYFSLATYHFQLVLVGGREWLSTPGGGNVLLPTNKLWVSGDEGKTWSYSLLPPMPTKRYGASAVSYGSDPEYLIVAGGVHVDPSEIVQSVLCLQVEVLREGLWYTVQPLSMPCVRIKSVICGEYWYFIGERYSGDKALYLPQEAYNYNDNQFGLCVNLNALLAGTDEDVTSKAGGDNIVWREFQIPYSSYPVYPVSFGGHLLTILKRKSTVICAYHPPTQSWIDVQSAPVYRPTVITALTSEQLLMMGNCGGYKATLKGVCHVILTPSDPVKLKTS